MANRKKEINIRIVAERAGVSVATVSRVVNNRTDVSEAMRQRIQSVISEFNFSPNKGVERVFNIGVIIATADPLMSDDPSQVITGMTQYSSKGSVDVSIIMYCGEGRQKSLLRLARERRCDAVAIVMGDSFEEEVEELRQARLPMMFVNRPMSGELLGYVNNDSYTGAAAAARYLFGCGHRKVGFLKMSEGENHTKRLQAYIDVFGGEAPLEPQRVIEHIATVRGQEAGYLQTRELFRRAPEVTAIICSNDEMAMGCYKACHDAGKRIPEDVSVIGFDDLPFATYLTPALTTVRQPLNEMGFRAIHYLDAYLKGHLETLPCETIPTEFICRDSVRDLTRN